MWQAQATGNRVAEHCWAVGYCMNGDFQTIQLATGVRLSHHRTRRFKTTRIDVFIQFPLERGRNTRVALLSRMLERGTARLPDLRALNRFVDGLHGASFGSGVSQFGDRQVIQLSMEMASDHLVPAGGDQLVKGVSFLKEVLCEPLKEGCGFPPRTLDQEKAALRQAIAGLFSDKAALARRRCIEEMCPDEPCGVSALGEVIDLPQIDAQSLFNFYKRALRDNEVDLYIVGELDPGRAEEICRTHFDWRRERPAGSGGHASIQPRPGSPTPDVRRIDETQDVQQGRVVLGYRTGVRFDDPQYAALALFNQLLGGDANSRLYRNLRETAGLCYHAGSFIEPSCGLMLVEASVDSPDCDEALKHMEAEVAAIRRGEIGDDELNRARRATLNRLRSIDEDRDGLIRFHYARGLARASRNRLELERRVFDVTAADVSRAAGHIKLDAVFTLRARAGESADGSS